MRITSAVHVYLHHTHTYTHFPHYHIWGRGNCTQSVTVCTHCCITLYFNFTHFLHHQMYFFFYLFFISYFFHIRSLVFFPYFNFLLISSKCGLLIKHFFLQFSHHAIFYHSSLPPSTVIFISFLLGTVCLLIAFFI